MLGLGCLSTSPTFHGPSLLPPTKLTTLLPFPLKPPRTLSGFHLFAQNNNNNNNLTQDRKDQQDKQQQPTNGPTNNNSNGGGLPPLFNIKWGALLLDPDPENILAVGLAGLLTWASVQVLWQLFFISLAIVAAALKYSFIAALLIFILITLL